jgi:hypothetical protein
MAKIKQLILLFVICAIGLNLGCGRTYRLAGRVVKTVDGAASSINETTGKDTVVVGEGIGGVTVTLFHELHPDSSPVRQSIWKKSVITDSEGGFELIDYKATSGRENLVGLEVTDSLFESVYTTYVDYFDPDLQTFAIRLRSKK